MPNNSTPTYDFWSREIFEATFRNPRFERVAQDLLDFMRLGYYLKPCTFCVSPQVCLIDGQQFTGWLPIELFVYQPVRRDPRYRGGQPFVSWPPVTIAEIAKMQWSGADIFGMVRLCPQLSSGEIAAALRMIDRARAEHPSLEFIEQAGGQLKSLVFVEFLKIISKCRNKIKSFNAF